MSDAEDCAEADIKALWRVLEKFLGAILIPYALWSSFEIIQLREWKTGIENSRFTAQDGYEMALETTRGLDLLQNSVNLLQQQNEELKQRVNTLEGR